MNHLRDRQRKKEKPKGSLMERMWEGRMKSLPAGEEGTGDKMEKRGTHDSHVVSMYVPAEESKPLP
jgi:hypothetical protein